MATKLRLTEQIELRIDDDTARGLAQQLRDAGLWPADEAAGPNPGREVFPDDHPIWRRHSGGSGHSAQPEWHADDLDAAEAFYAAVHGKARTFLDLLIERQGQRLSTDDIRRLAPDVFDNDHAIAGSVKGLSKPTQASGRRYPFYWWQERPTRYGMKPGVAALFEAARRRVGG